MKDKNSNKLKAIVSFPVFSLLALVIILNITNYKAFLKFTTIAKDFMTIQNGWMFSLMGVACFIVIIGAYFSPLGNVKIGGVNARPLLKKSSWFSITLCTTIASGIMFWGTAEPIWHLAYPPKSLGIEPMSAEAGKFAMETLFLHWTFIPYAIYSVPTVVFAFSYYNMKRSFSVGSEISPILGNLNQSRINVFIDAVVLFAVAAGISASFGTTVINMGGGMNALFGIENSKTLWVIITIIGTITFIASSATGLFKGIRIVRRHVAKEKLKYQESDKPVYRLFLARSIDNNTAETFRIGV